MNILIDRISTRRRNRFADEMEMHASIHGLKIEVPRLGISEGSEGKEYSAAEQEFTEKKLREMSEAKMRELNGQR